MSTFVGFRDANFTNEEGAGKILAKIVGQSVVVGAETSHRVEEKGGGADDTVDVQVGQVIIIDDDGFALRAWSDAIENLPVTSNSSGNPRIDVVVAYIDKAVEDNVNNNSPDGLVFAIVDGTPAGAPTPPNDATIQASVGADNPFIKLAQIAVADSFVSITDSEITDLREQFSIQSGGKKLQYNVATDTWEFEETLGVDTINEKTADTGTTVEGVLIKDGLVDDRDVSEMFWENLGETTLGAPADVITVASLPARKFLKILIFLTPTGGNVDGNLTFNNDSANNYARRIAINGGVDVTNAPVALINNFASSGDTVFGTYEVLNEATEEKLISGIGSTTGSAGAANAPNRRILVGKWANTSDSINRIDMNNIQAGSYDVGSKMIVLGHN